MQHAVLSAISSLKNPPPEKACLQQLSRTHTHTHTEEEEGGEGSKENCSWREIRGKSWLGTAIQTVMKVEETWGSFTHSWRALDECMPLGRHLHRDQTSSSLRIKKKKTLMHLTSLYITRHSLHLGLFCYTPSSLIHYDECALYDCTWELPKSLLFPLGQ